MKIVIVKGTSADTVEVRRGDGSTASASVPHKGPVPHDAVHFFLELELGFDAGFWGLVAGGLHPDEVGAIAKAAGHASASRALTPDARVVQAIQAERIVESFEADLWGGGSDSDTFNAMVEAGCEQSLVRTVTVGDEAIARVRNRLTEFQDKWIALPLGGSRSLEWPDERAS